MKAWAKVMLAMVATLCIGSQVVSACGDKFLLVGRGVRFQRAYAAIHPASILIVLPPKSVKSAAVRDGRLVDALKMAGHRVQVVQQPVNLAQVFDRTPHDIVLARRAEAAAIPATAPGSGLKPAVVLVLDEPSPSELAAARQESDYVVKTPQPLTQILNLLDDIMKARLDSRRRSPVVGE